VTRLDARAEDIDELMEINRTVDIATPNDCAKDTITHGTIQAYAVSETPELACRNDTILVVIECTKSISVVPKLLGRPKPDHSDKFIFRYRSYPTRTSGSRLWRLEA
jgi:hypothetical protein